MSLERLVTPPRRRRLWSELVPLEVLRSPGVLDLLNRYGASLIVAARPEAIMPRAALRDALLAARDRGVSCALWPMLEDGHGRWANARNAARYARFVRALVDDLGAHGLAPDELAVDLEPSFDDLSSVLSRPGAWRRYLREVNISCHSARETFSSLISWLAERGITAFATVAPLVVRDLSSGDARGEGWQAILGTPVDGLPWGGVNVMMYTSIVEGWSRGALRREDARSLLGLVGRALSGRFGAVPPSLSLGAVGVGALGDEPTLRTPFELQEDVALARACGVDDLALFDLSGVLARPPVEAWMEAFVETPAAVTLPGTTLRARTAWAAAGVAGLLPRARSGLHSLGWIP